MKRFGILFCFIASLVVVGCHKKKIQEPLKFEDPKPAEPAVVDDPPIPFTRDLYNQLTKANIPLNKVQFYNDQQLILNRGLSTGDVKVEHGKIIFQNGQYSNQITIDQNTPCTVDAVEPDGVRVKFDNSGNSFKFINNKYSPDFFIFSGSNWKDGSCDVLYDKLVYRATCGSCSSASDVKLLVKKSDISKLEQKVKKLPGSTVN